MPACVSAFVPIKFDCVSIASLAAFRIEPGYATRTPDPDIDQARSMIVNIGAESYPSNEGTFIASGSRVHYARPPYGCGLEVSRKCSSGGSLLWWARLRARLQSLC